MAPRLIAFIVKNYRSIEAPVKIRVPQTGPLVLLGENNAGKSNLTRALDILLGERWSGTITLEDHEFYGRDSDGIEVRVRAEVSDLPCTYCGGRVTFLDWTHDPKSDGDPTAYRFNCADCSKTFPNRAIADSLTQIRIDADRRLAYQLSYTTKYTLLSKLMHKFHKALTANQERRETLEEIFDALLYEFGEVAQFRYFRQLLATTAESFGLNLTYRLDIDFSAYDPSNFFRSLRVHPKLDGAVRSFDELGTGQEQILALAFSYAYAKAFAGSEGLVIVIDEPEAHLHPAAQAWLAAQLDRLHSDGLQVILTTHSPHFVNLVQLENIILVTKPDGEATKVRQLSRTDFVTHLIERGADPERVGIENVGDFSASSATTDIKNALFSRACVLVEGQTESFSIPELLRKVGTDVLKLGISVVSVEGLGNIAKWLRFFDAFEIPVYCIFDTDSHLQGKEAMAAELKRLDIFKALRMEAPDPLSFSALSVRPTFTTVDETFEPAMANLLGVRWESLYEEAKVIVGDSKPLRARWAAQRVELTHSAGVELSKLGNAVARLVGGDAPTQ